MKNLEDKACLNCGNFYTPTGRCSKFCSKACYKNFNKEKLKQQAWDYRRRQGKQVGVGSGGTTGKGKNNHMYKHGKYLIVRMRSQIKNDRRFCEHCGKDLLGSTHYQWVIHHRDRNQYNNELSNLELLCKKCHQLEHDCLLEFRGVTTNCDRDTKTGRFVSMQSSSQEGSEVPDTQASVAAGNDIV